MDIVSLRPYSALIGNETRQETGSCKKIERSHFLSHWFNYSKTTSTRSWREEAIYLSYRRLWIMKVRDIEAEPENIPVIEANNDL